MGLLGFQLELHLCLPVPQLVNAVLMLQLRHLFLTQEQKWHCYQRVSRTSSHTARGLPNLASVLEGMVHKSWKKDETLEMRMPKYFQAT